MDKIPSFQKDHNILQPGLYFSMQMHGVETFDLRFKRPNAGDYIPNAALHSIEHMLATVLRNSPQKDSIIYFGPMGCRTGFYLLTAGLRYRDVLALLKDALAKCLKLESVPGAERSECGNYAEHDLAGAKKECAAYLEILNGISEKTIAEEEKKESV